MNRIPNRSWSDVEYQCRVELAALYRAIALQGWDDHIFTHLSARVPDGSEYLLLNPLGLRFEEITASSLIKTDMQGRKTEDGPELVNLGGVVIHSAIYRARPAAQWVVHLHTQANAGVAAQRDGLLPISQSAMLLHGKIAYHDYEGLAIDFAECARLADDLGDCKIMVLRNHGSLIWGESVAEVFALTYQFERACAIQVAALSAGRPGVIVAPDQIAALTASQGNYEPRFGELSWNAMVRRLRRDSPGFDA